jgi:hypothetical protein
VRRKLTQLNQVLDLRELTVPVGNRLEALAGMCRGSRAFGSTNNIVSVFAGRAAMPMKSKSRTITERAKAAARRLVPRRLPTALPPTSPGEILLEDFLMSLGISQSAFAIRLGV